MGVVSVCVLLRLQTECWLPLAPTSVVIVVVVVVVAVVAVAVAVVATILVDSLLSYRFARYCDNLQTQEHRKRQAQQQQRHQQQQQ